MARWKIAITLLVAGGGLTACGGGSSGNQPLTASDVFEDETPAIYTGTLNTGNSTAATDQTTAGQPSAGGQSPETDEDPELSGPPAELALLYGQAFFSYAFTGDQTVFLLESNFTSESLVRDDSGVYMLTTDAATLVSSNDSGLNVDAQGQGRFTCHFNRKVDLYLCVAHLNSQVRVNMLLERVSNGQSTGHVEYCDVSVTSATDCIDDLVKDPDGGARLQLVVGST